MGKAHKIWRDNWLNIQLGGWRDYAWYASKVLCYDRPGVDVRIMKNRDDTSAPAPLDKEYIIVSEDCNIKLASYDTLESAFNLIKQARWRLL